MHKIKIKSSPSALNNIFEGTSHSMRHTFQMVIIRNQKLGSEEVSFEYQYVFQHEFINTSSKYMEGICWKWRSFYLKTFFECNLKNRATNII